MCSRLLLLPFLALLLAVVLADPQPTPAPQLENRQLSSIISVATGGAGSLYSAFTSGAASVGDGILTTVISYGGHAYTVVSSKGGEAVTLASSGAGVATSKFGSIYTVATAAVVSGAAPSIGLQTPSLVGLATVILSALVGAIIVA